MIVMLDTPQDLDKCAIELGCKVEQLFTPLTARNPQNPKQMFCMDNGAFSHFELKGFLSMLKKHSPRKHLCRFVALPDVVGSAIRTLECFNYWKPKMGDWKAALVAQDGQESLAIPWDSIDAIFLGGSTDWKLSKGAAQIVKAAKIMEKWVHIGRVNTPGRFEYFEEMGADSCDGTGLARYTEMRTKIYQNKNEPKLAL